MIEEFGSYVSADKWWAAPTRLHRHQRTFLLFYRVALSRRKPTTLWTMLLRLPRDHLFRAYDPTNLRLATEMALESLTATWGRYGFSLLPTTCVRTL